MVSKEEGQGGFFFPLIRTVMGVEQAVAVEVGGRMRRGEFNEEDGKRYFKQQVRRGMKPKGRLDGRATLEATDA